MSSEDEQIKVLIMTRRWPSETNPHSGTWVRDQTEALERLGIRCDVLWDVEGGGIWPYIRMRRAMRARLAGENYQLLHAHYGFTGIVAATQRTAPVLVTFHGTDVLGRPYARPYRRVFGWVEQRLSRLLAQRITHAVVVSPHIREMLNAPRATTVPMGIDPERFVNISQDVARKQLDLDPAARIVIFVGNPSLRVKRFELADRAVERARRTLPSIQLVTVHGRTPEDVALFMSAADALILTSYSEGSPTVVKEAMACNLPVITVNVGDVQDQLAGVQPSYVCDSTVESLAEALIATLETPVRSNGRGNIHRFTNDGVATMIADLYRKIVGGVR